MSNAGTHESSSNDDDLLNLLGHLDGRGREAVLKAPGRDGEHLHSRDKGHFWWKLRWNFYHKKNPRGKGVHWLNGCCCPKCTSQVQRSAVDKFRRRIHSITTYLLIVSSKWNIKYWKFWTIVDNPLEKLFMLSSKCFYIILFRKLLLNRK